MIFFKISSVFDLASSSVDSRLYSDLLWVGPADEMPVDKAVSCVGIPGEGETLTIRVAMGNPIPLFFGWDSVGCLVLSDSCKAVWDAISASTTVKAEHLDRVGLIESFLFDGPLASRTLLEGVRKFQMGELASIDLMNQTIESSWHWLPSIQSTNINESDALSIAKENILRLSDSFNDMTSATFPLTGGLDSRLLAGLARYERNMDLSTYTFQRGPSLETWCAKKVARSLDVRHLTVDLPAKECYQEFAKEVVGLTGGMISGMHCHGLYSCQWGIPNSIRDLPRVFGYFGDPVTGAMTDEEGSRDQFNCPESIMQKYKLSLFPEVVERYRAEILADLNVSYEAFCKSGSKDGTYHEFWKIQQRQNNLITHLFAYHRGEHSTKVVLPFLDEEFVQFFLGLPYDLRKNRSLFKKACKSIYPQLFNLPSMHFGKGTFFSMLESLFEKVEGACNKLYHGQEFFLSPFKYEQHEKNLYNYLRSDVQKGVDIMCDIEGVTYKDAKFPVWKYSTPKEYYRLCALSYLIS